MSGRPRPLPTLPWDILRLVCEQADPSALAALGGVSLDFLEVTSSLLYGAEVVITSLKGLRQLFCEREEHETRPSSRINSFLSLSQIQTFSLDFASINALPPQLPISFTLSSSRISNPLPTPIPLQTLNFTLHFRRVNVLNHLYQGLLFPWINPARFNLTVLHRPFDTSSWHGAGRTPPLSHWTRITVLDIRGLLPWTHKGGSNHFLGLQPPSLSDSPGRVVHLHLGSLCYSALPHLPEFVKTLGLLQTGPFHVEGMEEGSIVLVVGSEEEKSDAEGEVALFEPQSRRKTFKVVVE